MNAWDPERNQTEAEPPPEPLELRLQCLTYDDRGAVIPTLTEAIDRAGGWVLERQVTAAHTVELRIELQMRALVDMYAALVGSGVQLTRDTHLQLAERCNCRQHQDTNASMATVLAMRLEVAFLADREPQTNWMQWMMRSAATA